jgi:hypothetical protein
MQITYDRRAAVDYARKWAHSRNPAYFDFSRLGGDCTNFASQALRAGALPFNQSAFGWYYLSASKRSASFSGVEFLHNFLTNKGTRRGPVAAEAPLTQLEPGDLVQLSFDGVRFAHTLVVVKSGETPNEILVAAHSLDSLDRPLPTYSYATARGLHILGANQ